MIAAQDLVHRITVSEYERMAEAGVLDSLRRYELLEGVIIDVSLQNDPHIVVVVRLTEKLILASGGRYELRPQVPIYLNAFSLPEPDIALVRCGIQRRANGEEALLVIEVSDSTYRLDAVDKLAAYAAAGIPEYWVVNVRKKQIELHRKPHGRSYQGTTVAAIDEAAAPLAFPDVKVTLRELLPSTEG
jgi:Uma2 family endonuclease